MKAIIFDFGGVLLDLDISKTERAMSDLLETEIISPYPKAYKELTLALETGKILPEYFIWSIQNMCKVVPPPQKVIAAWNAMLCGWQLDRFKLLDELNQNYDVYLLSNTNQIHLDYVMRELKSVYNIHDFEDRFFTKCFYSHKLGSWKPQEDIYRQVENDIKHSTDDFVFIDDNHLNVEAAISFGWNA